MWPHGRSCACMHAYEPTAVGIICYTDIIFQNFTILLMCVYYDYKFDYWGLHTFSLPPSLYHYIYYHCHSLHQLCLPLPTDKPVFQTQRIPFQWGREVFLVTDIFYNFPTDGPLCYFDTLFVWAVYSCDKKTCVSNVPSVANRTSGTKISALQQKCVALNG